MNRAAIMVLALVSGVLLIWSGARVNALTDYAPGEGFLIACILFVLGVAICVAVVVFRLVGP